MTTNAPLRTNESNSRYLAPCVEGLMLLMLTVDRPTPQCNRKQLDFQTLPRQSDKSTDDVVIDTRGLHGSARYLAHLGRRDMIEASGAQ